MTIDDRLEGQGMENSYLAAHRITFPYLSGLRQLGLGKVWKVEGDSQ